ncbi:hypothetical protein GWK47_028931 [Chionoecetes opilio]|uniref:Monocarboxylate transporter n=1 Tax=Chionoecetes opilio TaxID=41210 RepID=A0A8J4YND3_CHIOP|nr:hypothetical protein GWK47_028931 [Chionoecetes opilio]
MILANPLSQEFGQRTVGFASVFMASLSLILSGFSPSVSFLYFSYSLLGGMCTGVSQGIAYMVLPPYFHKKGGQANTILVAGAPVTQRFWRPSFAISWKCTPQRCCLDPRRRRIEWSHCRVLFSPRPWHLKPLMSAGSDVSCRIPCLSDEIEESTTREKSRGVKAIWKTLWRVAGRIRSDLKVLRQLRCVILAVTVMITQTTFFNFIMMLPFVAQATDHSLQDAAGCIALMGVTNLVTRLVVSPLSDCKRFSIRFSIMLGYLLRAIGILARHSSDAHTTGVIRDTTNSYLTSLCVMAALDLLSVCLWLLMPAAQARDARTELRPKTSYDATRP